MSAVGQETDFNWGMSKKSEMHYSFQLSLCTVSNVLHLQ